MQLNTPIKYQKETKLDFLPFRQFKKMGMLYSLYRLVISIFLFLSSYATFFSNDSLAASLPSLLQQATLFFYCLFSFLLLAILYFSKRHITRQLGIGLAIDVVAISLLLFTSGAPNIQLAMLYLVVVSASFLMLPPSQATVITLSAIIFIIYQQFFYAISNRMGIVDLGDALLLSLSFIGVGYLSWYVSQRLDEIEKLAAQQASEVDKLSAVNEQVVRSINHGVMVLGNDLILQLTNKATITLLNLELQPDVVVNVNKDEHAAKSFMQVLNDQHAPLAEWLTHTTRQTPATFIYPIIENNLKIGQLRINTTPLQGESILVLIEDIQREQMNAQQLKLASLGQLTASIAHEIRNPLAAISQASQLLIEDAEIHTQQNEGSLAQLNNDDSSDGSNIELYEMIFNQTKRVNRIIEDVLKLSKQTKPDVSVFEISEWITQFAEDHYSPPDLIISGHCKKQICFDTRQLEQILINLVNNGIRQSRKIDSKAKVEIKIECPYDDVIIDVLDTGAGIKPEDQHYLFNPFFTTDINGTGLGLYLSQAFAQANNAKLVFVPDHPKTCFRLIVPNINNLVD